MWGLLVSLVWAVSAKVQLTWERVDFDDWAGTPPPALRGSVAVAVDQMVVMFGGWDGKHLRDNTWIYDGKTWSGVASNGGWAPSPREQHAGAAFDKTMYIYGGELTDFSSMDTFEAFDTATMSWRHIPVTGNKPPPLARHTLTTVGSKLYLFGGREGLGRLNEHMYMFDTSTESWEKLITHGVSPHRRSLHAASAVNTTIFVICGSIGLLTDQPYGDIHAFDTETRTWESVLPHGAHITPLEGLTACTFGRQVVVFGGYDGHQTRSTVYVLDSETKRITKPEIEGEKPEGRVLHSVVALHSKMLLIGGVMQLEESADFYGDPYVLKIIRVLDLDGSEGNSPPRRSLTDLLQPTLHIDTTSTMDDTDKANIYAAQHPDRLPTIKRALEWEQKFENITTHLARAQMAVSEHHRSKGLPDESRASPFDVPSESPHDAALNPQTAFQTGMELGLSIEPALKDADVTGELDQLRDPQKMSEMKKAPVAIEVRREIAGAMDRFRSRVTTNPALLQELDQALREAEDWMLQQAKADEAILQQAQATIKARETTQGAAAVQQELENLMKSDLAIKVNRESSLSRVAHMLRMLDSHTTANMLMQAVQGMDQQAPQQTSGGPESNLWGTLANQGWAALSGQNQNFNLLGSNA